MPLQKPGRSAQVVQTPPEFLERVRNLLKIDDWAIDLAANKHNTVCDVFLSKQHDALRSRWRWQDFVGAEQWAWLNPPFGRIEPWVQKTCETKGSLSNYAGIAVLLPASVGSNWWATYVDKQCLVLLLKGRLTFVGHTSPYPKDLVLLLYSLPVKPGYEVWDWRHDAATEC